MGYPYYGYNYLSNKTGFMGGLLMLKGKLGITLSAVAVLSFVLAFLGNVPILVLVVGYALIVEGNNWLTKQTLQALYLGLTYVIVNTILGGFFGATNYFFGKLNIRILSDSIGNIQFVCDKIITLGLLALCIIAIIKLLKDQDANLPILGNLADKSLGIIKVKVAPQPQQQYTQPQAAPVQTPVQPTSETWVCACGKENTGKFCSVCGAKNPNA